MSGSRELCARLKTAKIFVSHEGGARYGFDTEEVSDGDRFEFGRLMVAVKYTPGHTPEHMRYVLAEKERVEAPWGVLTGDSLFVNSAGRPDLLGGKTGQLAGQLFPRHQRHDASERRLMARGHLFLHWWHRGRDGYCPGTVAAALGQGNYDGLFSMLGLVVGSYLYAESSKRLKSTVEKWGDKGKLMLPDALHIPRALLTPVFALMLGGVLFALERFTVR